jgi:branched-chain amino acid transport system substrate-binding protein
MKQWRGRRRVATAAVAIVTMATAALVAVFTNTAEARSGAASKVAAGSPYKVGIIYCRTGPLAEYGSEFVEGLRFGLQYATKGTNAVGGHPIQLTLKDETTNPATAVSEAKDLIGQGYKIIGGSCNSAIALQIAPVAAQNQVLFLSGAAANDAITGVNRFTFRAGRQTYQDVLAANSFLGKSVGKKILVFAQDYVFGQGNVAAVKAVLGGRGHTVSSILVPLSATDFTPFAKQAAAANPDLLFFAWAGDTTAAVVRALQQQGVVKSTTITAGLAQRSTWSIFGDAATDIKFLSHYVWNAPHNKVNSWLIAQMRKRGQLPDLFTPDGFVEGMMIVRALQKGGASQDVDAMISGLEGWQFLAPKGVQRIRPQDHAMIQPMFQVQLVKQPNGKFKSKVLKTISPGNVQPPVTPFK